MKNYLRTALKTSTLHTNKKYNVVALAFKGGKFQGLGTNKIKTDPTSNSRFKLIHAEESLAKRVKLDGCSVLVVRVSKRGELVMARPCKTCLKVLINRGVRRIFYTTNNIIVEE